MRLQPLRSVCWSFFPLGEPDRICVRHCCMAWLVLGSLVSSQNSTSGMKVRCSSTAAASVRSSYSNSSEPIPKYPLTPAAYVFGIVVYLTVTISSLRTIVNPIHDVDTREDQVMAMRVLSAGNVIIIIALVLILALQVTPFSRPSAQFEL